jgi:ankyrin repeat protein
MSSKLGFSSRNSFVTNSTLSPRSPRPGDFDRWSSQGSNPHSESPTIFETIKNHDFEKTSELIKFVANINDRNSEGQTPLDLAIYLGDFPTIQLLVYYGADINQKNHKENTYLHDLIRKGKYDLVLQLIQLKEKETDDKPILRLDEKNNTGKTPLHLAVISRRKDIIKTLLDHGAKANIQSNDGRTPLHWAAINGDCDAANLLLAAGAKINQCTKHNTTPLIFAAHNKEDAMVELLVYREATIRGENAEGDTALKLIASHKNYKIMESYDGSND